MGPFSHDLMTFAQTFEQNKPHILLGPFTLDGNVKEVANSLDIKPSAFIGIQSKANVISKMKESMKNYFV